MEMRGSLLIDHLPNKCKALYLISKPMKTSGEWREREESNREKKRERRREGKNGRREEGKRKSEAWGKEGKRIVFKQ